MKVILQSVDYGRDRHLQRVLPIHNYGGIQVLHIFTDRTALEEDDGETYEHLECFGDQHSCGGDVHVSTDGSGIAHAQDEQSVLYRQN